MNTIYQIPPRPKKNKRNWLWFLLAIGLVFILLFVAYEVYERLQEKPNETYRAPSFGSIERPVFVEGNMLEFEASGSGEELSLPLTLLQEYVDPFMIYDEKSDSLIITTRNQVIQMQTNQLTAYVNEEPLTLHFPVRKLETDIYVPVAPLLSFYDLHVEETSEGATLLRKGGDLIRWVEVPATISENDDEAESIVFVRHEPSIQAPILQDLTAGDRVELLEETTEGWYLVQTAEGYLGYVNKLDVKLANVEIVPKKELPAPNIPWKPLGGKINLTWEAVYGRNPDTNAIPAMPGLNVVSPTWFSLKGKEDGTIYVHNLGDKAYVNWAHQRGYQVWGLFSNDFDPDLTTRALADFETRQQIIRELLSLAELYDLQGINIDFENVYLKDKDNVTQFVREFTPYAHEQNLVVSIDVTIRGGSEMWSLFADREALGQIVDYMMVMTYDQHWRASPVAGSVAALPWVEKGITDIITYDHVPPEKIVLGVPFYTYQWIIEYKDGQQVGIQSKTLFMRDVEAIIKNKELVPVFSEEDGQHYVEYEEDGKTVKIWIEDAVSMQRRAELVNKLGIAGIASWRRGFETPDIWETIKETLEQRP